MREAEGAKLRTDVLDRVAYIEVLVGQVEALSPETVSQYRAKLYEKMRSTQHHADRRAENIARSGDFLRKSWVDEETVRLRSHFEQLRTMLSDEEIVGRKLDSSFRNLTAKPTQ